MPRDGTKNLIPINQRTKDEQRRIATAGGKASGKARRKKKALKETMAMLLELPVKDIEAKDKMAEFGVKRGDIDNNTRLMFTLLNKAFSGDVMAIKEVRSVIGEDVNGEAIDKLDEMLKGLKDNADTDK